MCGCIIPRQYSLVKFDVKSFPKEYYAAFDSKKRFIFLGEIPNMSGHCVVAEKHTGNLR